MASPHCLVILPHMLRWKKEERCKQWLQHLKATIFYATNNGFVGK